LIGGNTLKPLPNHFSYFTDLARINVTNLFNAIFWSFLIYDDMIVKTAIYIPTSIYVICMTTEVYNVDDILKFSLDSFL